MLLPRTSSTLFPYTTLFRSLLVASLAAPVLGQSVTATVTGTVTDNTGAALKGASVVAENRKTGVQYPTKSNEDRKSTRLNSSHLGNSYAVFCLKKKRTN